MYFCLCIDPSDNELAALEAIHLFVEVLDMYFKSVCELDLVFYFYKVRSFKPDDLKGKTKPILTFSLFFMVFFKGLCGSR